MMVKKKEQNIKKLENKRCDKNEIEKENNNIKMRR